MENNINVIDDFFIVTDRKIDIVEVCESCSFESSFFTRIRASERAASFPRCKTESIFFLGGALAKADDGRRGFDSFTFLLLH